MAARRSEYKPEKKSGSDAQSLHASIAELTDMIEEFRREVKALREENEQLRSALQEAQRAALRQAAPFRIKEKKRVEDPKPPGRKKGHQGSCRRRPPKVDRKVEVALDRCPHCGGKSFADVSARRQWIEEIPPITPVVTELVTYEGRCQQCQSKVHSTHPLQVSTSGGAAATHLGPRALALAADLNKRHGLSTRKSCRILARSPGLRVWNRPPTSSAGGTRNPHQPSRPPPAKTSKSLKVIQGCGGSPNSATTRSASVKSSRPV